MFIYIHKSLHVYAASDAGLMMQNLMLSAHAHGLGTCAQGAVNIWDDAIRKEFDISKYENKYYIETHQDQWLNTRLGLIIKNDIGYNL